MSDPLPRQSSSRSSTSSTLRRRAVAQARVEDDEVEPADGAAGHRGEQLVDRAGEGDDADAGNAGKEVDQAPGHDLVVVDKRNAAGVHVPASRQSVVEEYLQNALAARLVPLPPQMAAGAAGWPLAECTAEGEHPHRAVGTRPEVLSHRVKRGPHSVLCGPVASLGCVLSPARARRGGRSARRVTLAGSRPRTATRR